MVKRILLAFMLIGSTFLNAQYTVTMVKGAVAKPTYAAQDTVHILANPAATGFVFDR